MLSYEQDSYSGQSDTPLRSINLFVFFYLPKRNLLIIENEFRQIKRPKSHRHHNIWAQASQLLTITVKINCSPKIKDLRSFT